MVWQKFLSDFLFGGFLIALVLGVVRSFGPFLGGVIAALPVRSALTIFLGILYNPSAGIDITTGALATGLANMGL